MLISLWLMGHFTLLTILVSFGISLPASPGQALLLAATALLATAQLGAVIAWSRRTISAVIAPPAGARTTRPAIRVFILAEDPGIPGSAHARAPSQLVRTAG